MSTVTKTVILVPGESFTLPPGATVITTTGILTSNCTIPDPTEMQAYSLVWQKGEEELSDAYFTELILNGTLSYILPNPAYNGEAITTAVNGLGNPLLNAYCFRDEDLDEGSSYIACFTFPKFAILPKVKFLNPASSGGTSAMYMEFTEATGCNCS